MIDGNTLILNQATISKAIESWLNTVVLKSEVDVESVSYNASSTNFEVVLS